jgi:hypothetical protein
MIAFADQPHEEGVRKQLDKSVRVPEGFEVFNISHSVSSISNTLGPMANELSSMKSTPLRCCQLMRCL